MYVQIKQVVQCTLSLNILFIILLRYVLLLTSCINVMEYKLMLCSLNYKYLLVLFHIVSFMLSMYCFIVNSREILLI
jgi:hypothetical protein